LRDVAREFLATAGYKVLVAENGATAAKLAADHKDPIHLLLTDVVMPGIGGSALAEQFKQFHPEGRVLFMSGYAPNAIVHHGILDDGVNLLNKPFTRQRLTQKVREVLEA
jgi:DNA-binding NtrC family response regulator